MSHTLQRVENVGLGSAKFWLIRRGQHLKIALVFAPPFPVYLHHPRACSIILRIGLSGPAPLGGWANLNVIDKKLGCALEGVLACRLGLLEQWP